MIDLDRMNNLDASEAAQAALRVVDRVQDARTELQVVGIAAAFSAFCRKHRVDPAEAFRAATNILATKHREDPAFVALDLYVRYEL